MKLYLIPGLGFDHRIFKNLDLTAFSYEYLDWIEPSGQESISEYANRMAEKIDRSPGKKILIGHSLGGIISQEIAKLIDVDRIILISSIQAKNEMPLQFKLIKKFGLYKIFYKNFIISSHKYWARNYGYQTEEEQDLFRSMIGKQSNAYLQWALKALCNWQTPTGLANTEIIQIHGEIDKTFPLKLIEAPTHIIKGGGHFMIYNNAEALERFLLKELK